MSKKTSIDDIIGIVKNDEHTDSVTLKKEAQLSICEKRLMELERENEQLKQQVKDCLDSVPFWETALDDKKKLQNENEQLNSRIRCLENKIQRERNATTNQHLRWSDEAETKIKELEKENEELREQVKCLLEDLQSTNQINKEIVDDVREELLKENEQLKKDREDLKRYLVVKDREIIKLRKENNEMKFNKGR